MATYISQVDVSLNKTHEQHLLARGFKKLPNDLNKGACGNEIYIWYKEGQRGAAITRLQVSHNPDMATGLASAGYTQIAKDLNAGAGGDYIYLWYHRGSGEYDTPIVDIDVTTDAKNEAAKFRFGWERLSCDLNRNAGGSWVHFWVKRAEQTYICDITATDSYGSDTDLFQGGYIRVDENTNRGAGGSEDFIWYRQTTDPKQALTDLQVSTSEAEVFAFQQQGYTCVSVNLSGEGSGQLVYVWYKKGGPSNHIKAFAVLVNSALIPAYTKAGLTVIDKDIDAGSHNFSEYLCVYQ
ncbi:hypothetical protein EYF80_010905 [Liparis tanakae]|uniref:MABP domain-containing protein n=1 Tax=Liparis tanakae TaxID=230148 RepID=A0A4Z2ILL4_9TELE|nr:hypothetical protein EYF80_010905 [Liparis tanakae]